MSEQFKELTFGNYKVRKARAADAGTVLQIWCDIARWLKSKGVSQWEYLLRGEGSNEVEQAIKAGITYIVENSEGNAAAVFNFSSKQNDWDIGLWGVRDDSAYYLHKLIVTKDQQQQQQQLGKQILNWIDKNIHMKDGYVRLDCYADNTVLNDFYQQAGYKLVGQTSMGEEAFSIYEKHFIAIEEHERWK